MANRTDPSARTIHGTNPQNLIEKIVRLKIYAMPYWKEKCFGLNAETLVDRAVALDHVGGTYGGNQKATNFMCLILKMLQIQPEKEIVVELIKNEDYKYVRVLGAFYLRLVGSPLDVYQYLEPLYNDYRKVRCRNLDGTFKLSHVDEVIDEMLTTDFMLDIALPRIPARWSLEQSDKLEPRISALEDDFDEELEEEADVEAKAQAAALELEMVKEEARAKWRGSDAPPPPPRERPPRDEDEPRRPREDDERRGRDDDGRRDRDDDRARESDRGERDRHRERGERERGDRDRSDRDRRERPGAEDRDRERRRDDERRRSPDRRDRGGGGRERDERKRRSSRSPPRNDERRRDRDRDRERDRDPRDDKKKRKMEEDPEIAEANAMRAKLGLKPLK